MHKLVTKLVLNRKITIFLFLVIMIIGLALYFLLPRQEFPDRSMKECTIVTIYPGAGAKDVHNLVSTKIEEKMMEIDGYDSSSTTSNESFSLVSVEFDLDVNTEVTMQAVRNKMADIKSELPEGVLNSIINTNLTEDCAILLSVSGSNYENSQLTDYAEAIKEELLKIDGIRKIEINGELKKEVNISVDTQKLSKLNINISRIADILRAQNTSMPQGNVVIDGEKIRINTQGAFESITEIKNTVIAVSKDTGVMTKLGDISEVFFDVNDESPKYESNEDNAVFLSVFIKNNINGITIGEKVKATINKLSIEYPQDLNIGSVFFGPDDVAKSLNMFLSNFLVGLGLVVIVLLIGMGLKNALVISLSLPATIFCTFITMYLLGIKLEQMSLVGLIIALGAIVDNSVVVGDSVQYYVDNGEKPLKAACKGASVSAIAILGATITTVLSFFPLSTIEGIVGQFIRPISLVFIIAVIFSYIVAEFFIPSVASLVFKPSKNISRKSWIKDIFLSVFDKLYKFKVITLLLVLGFFVLVGLFFVPGVEFFPYADKNFFVIDVSAEKKADLAETEKIVHNIRETLNKEDETVSFYSVAGKGMPKFYATIIPLGESADSAQLVYNFDLNKSDRFTDKGEFQTYLQKVLDQNIAGATIEVKRLSLSFPGAEIQVMLTGDNLEELKTVKNQIKKEMAKMEGLTNLADDMGDDTYNYRIKINAEKAMQLGITKYDIQQQVFIAMYGSTTSIFRKDANEYNIVLKSQISDISDLELLEIVSPSTRKAALKELATIEPELETNVFKTNDNKNCVTISANSLPGYNAAELTNQIENEIMPNIETYSVNVDFEGERANIFKYFGSALILSAIAIALIYIVLCIQLNSFLIPFVITFTIPLGIAGSLIGLTLMGKPLSLTALFGIIALSGIVINNGILLIEHIIIARRSGESLAAACRQALERRFKPVMLTAITTVLGFLPLAFSNDSLFSPLASALMGGLIFSTFSTIFVIPILYSIISKKEPKTNELYEELEHGLGN